MLEKFKKKEHREALKHFREWYNEEIQFYILAYLLSLIGYQQNQDITTYVHEKCKKRKYYDNYWMVLYNMEYLEIRGLIELEKKDVPAKDEKYRITSKGIDSLACTGLSFGSNID